VLAVEAQPAHLQLTGRRRQGERLGDGHSVEEPSQAGEMEYGLTKLARSRDLAGRITCIMEFCTRSSATNAIDTAADVRDSMFLLGSERMG
jgi:hypothetical protein